MCNCTHDCMVIVVRRASNADKNAEHEAGDNRQLRFTVSGHGSYLDAHGRNFKVPT